MPSNKAFTLLELLVVIAIIGILSSIVIVSMSGSTDSATIAKGKAYAQQVHALLGHEAVLNLAFNENAHDTCPDGADICDASGYDNNGEIYNDAHFVESPVDGYAVSFDGSGDYINIPAVDMGLTKNFNFSAWLYSVNPSSIRMSIFSQTSLKDSFSIECGTFETNTVTYMVFCTGVGVRAATANDSLINDEWIFLSYNSLSSGLHEIYINGIKQALATNLSLTFVSSANAKQIGQRGNNSQWYNGLIDEVHIYSEALPTTEIQKHYVQGLEKLLVNQSITRAEYDQRMKEFNQSLVLNEF